MKHQLLSQLLSQPWNIDPLRGRTILGHLVATMGAASAQAAPASALTPRSMERVGDVGIIPLCGTVAMNLPDWFKPRAADYGFCDANDICEDIAAAAQDPAVAMIVLDVNSPGGLSLAGDKLFAAVEAARQRKPVFAWCADGAEMCSTAYEAAASAAAILAGPYAVAVGCIGSYIALLDETQFWAKMGIAWEVFRSGEFKGMGIDALSEEQAAFLQSQVDAAGATFRANVSKYRTGIAAADMRGQWFSGSDAAARGFVAGTARDLPDALAKFRRMI